MRRLPFPESIRHLGTFGNRSDITLTSNIMLPNLIEQPSIADAQQLGGTLAIPARLLECVANGLHFGFGAQTAESNSRCCGREIGTGHCARNGSLPGRRSLCR